MQTPPPNTSRLVLESSAPLMQEALARSRAYAPANRSVLLVGPVGSGKTTLAQLIHHWSGRSGPFVAVSGGEVLETLFQDAFFGHVAGAFTGASSKQAGAFERAAGGTLLFDDLTYLPLVAQSALLRVLQDRRFLPIGATREQSVTCREIFATTIDPGTLVQRGQLLPDLASRIGALIVQIPPLSQRRVDIPRMAEKMAQDFVDEHGASAGVVVGEEAMEVLCNHEWETNIRGLKHAVEAAILHAGMSGPLIRIERAHLPDDIFPLSSNRRRRRLTPELVARIVENHGGNQTEAARELSVHRNTIRNYLRKYSA